MLLHIRINFSHKQLRRVLQSQYNQENRNLISQFQSKVKELTSLLSSLNIITSNDILNTLQYPTCPPASSAEGYGTCLHLASQLPPFKVLRRIELQNWVKEEFR